MQSCMSISSSSKSLQSLVQFTKFRFEDMTHNPDDSTHVMSLLVSVPTFMSVVMLFMFKSNITYLMLNSHADSFFLHLGYHHKILRGWGTDSCAHDNLPQFSSQLDFCHFIIENSAKWKYCLGIKENIWKTQFCRGTSTSIFWVVGKHPHHSHTFDAPVSCSNLWTASCLNV